jgi:Recombinase
MAYVWREDKRGYLVNIQEAEIVDLVFEWYVVQRWSVYAILQHLRSEYPDRNRKVKGVGQWSKSTVWRMLRNPYYIGKGNTHKWQYDDQPGINKKRHKSYRPEEEQNPIAEDIIPAIISEERFNQAQEYLSIGRQMASRNIIDPEKSLLRSGFAICGNCGEKLVARRQGKVSYDPDNRRKHPRNERYRYECKDPLSQKRCNKVCIECHIVDDDVWKYIMEEFIQNPENMENRLRDIEEEISKNENIDLTPIDTKLVEVEKQQKSCAKSIIKFSEDEYMISILQQEASELAKTRRELEKLRGEIVSTFNTQEKVRSKIDVFRKKWKVYTTKLEENITYADKREAVQILGIKVVVYSNGHKPRYKIQGMPPDIEFLISLHRVKLPPRP